MPFTTAYHQSQLNHVAGTSYPAAPTTVYLALFYSLPNAAGSGGSEATGTRSAITFGSAAADSGGWQTISNNASVTQTIASAGWIVGFGIYTASTGGTLIYHHTLPGGFEVKAGQSVVIPVGAITLFQPML